MDPTLLDILKAAGSTTHHVELRAIGNTVGRTRIALDEGDQRALNELAKIKGTRAGYREDLVSGVTDIARGFANAPLVAGHELIFIPVDAIGLLDEQLIDGYEHQALSYFYQNLRATPNLDARKRAQLWGRATAGIGTLGGSELLLSGVDYAKTGDGTAFREQLGAQFFYLSVAVVANARASGAPRPATPPPTELMQWNPATQSWVPAQLPPGIIIQKMTPIQPGPLPTSKLLPQIPRGGDAGMHPARPPRGPGPDFPN
jgi:hypothetical protein